MSSLNFVLMPSYFFQFRIFPDDSVSFGSLVRVVQDSAPPDTVWVFFQGSFHLPREITRAAEERDSSPLPAAQGVARAPRQALAGQSAVDSFLIPPKGRPCGSGGNPRSLGIQGDQPHHHDRLPGRIPGYPLRSATANSLSPATGRRLKNDYCVLVLGSIT